MSDLTPGQIAEGWRIANRQIDNLAGKLHAVRAERNALKGALEECRKAHARPAALKPLIELQQVMQEDPDGCGVAVLAMLTGQSYAEVDAEWPLRLTEHWDSDVKPYMMMDYLWERGYSLLVVRSRRYADGERWPSLRPFAPMHYAMVDSPTLPTGHWIAVDGEGVPFDPFDASRKTFDVYPRMHEIVGVWPSALAALVGPGGVEVGGKKLDNDNLEATSERDVELDTIRSEDQAKLREEAADRKIDSSYHDGEALPAIEVRDLLERAERCLADDPDADRPGVVARDIREALVPPASREESP